MNLRDVKTVLKALVETQTPVTPFLWGRHGVGKSSAVRQVGLELGYRVITVTLSQKEAVDLAGVLYTYRDEDLGLSVTGSHPPDWFATAVNKGKLILFLDEFNQARAEVMNAAFSLVLDRELSGVKLPPSVAVICAGNPNDDRYDTTPMGEALRDRFMHIKITHDTDAWLEFAKTSNSGIHADVVKFIDTDRRAAYREDEKDKAFPVEIRHSERSWERVSLIHRLPLRYALKTECINGIVGPDLAVAFMKSLGIQLLPIEAAEILNNPETTREKVTQLIKKGRLDVLTTSVNNLVAAANGPHGETLIRMNFGNVDKFIASLPEDLATSARLQVAFATSPLKEKKVG